MMQHPLLEYRERTGKRAAVAAPVCSPSPLGGIGGRVPQKALAEFTRSLAVMVGARLTLLDALETAAQQAKSARLRSILERVAKELGAGRSLSDSLASHPAVFDALYVQLTRAGEAAGVLGEVLLRLASHLEKMAALKRKVRLALAYPAVVLTVAAGATTFLLTTIVPTFAELFRDFGAELPAPTRAVLALSAVARNYWWLAVAGAGLTYVVLARLGRTDRGRLALDRLLLRLPLFGPLLLKSLVARFCRTLGTLLSSGVPLEEGLKLLSEAMGNRHLEGELAAVLGRVRRGSAFGEGVRKAGLFPPMVVEMIAVGEETAELDRLLEHAAAHYEAEVDAFVEALTSVVEPVMIVVIGLVIGAILISMYLPMFDLVTVVR